MRLSYHGWAALLLVLSSALAAGGIALGITPVSVDSGDGTVVACGFPWAPAVGATAQCAAGFGQRGAIGQLLVLFGVVLFGGVLLVGMLVAGIRDALAGHAQRPNAPATPPAA